MITYIISSIIGLIVGLIVMHILDVHYLQSITNSFDRAQETYIRGMESLRNENTRLHEIVNRFQISEVEKYHR